MSGITDKTTDALGASLDFRLLRHNVTAANIANAETPNYKAKKVDFEEALSRALDHEGLGKMATSDPEHLLMGQGPIAKARAEVYENPDANLANDGNTVDMERELSNLAENSILYKAALQLINKKLASLKYAVSEGGR
ncbi:MAG: flagellar basal body rod protein FlgB [Bdellovibrionales bacterium]|nr:flagellar basal body rod protein FlgB [Bdellovibrionales bacterium]